MLMMKRHLAVAAIAAAGSVIGSSALAQPDTARVLSATPIYDRVTEPRRECRTEYVTTDDVYARMASSGPGAFPAWPHAARNRNWFTPRTWKNGSSEIT